MHVQEQADLAETTPSRADLLQRITALEGLAARRGLMMTAAGHDLRQPLQIILSAVERASAMQTDQGVDFWRGVVMDQVSRLSHGLGELMMASDDDYPFFDGAMCRFPVVQTFQWLESEWVHAAGEKGLGLRFIPTSLEVSCDAAILRTMLTNLVGNAIKYTSKGGIVVGCRRKGDHVAIDVVDSGCGIDAALQHSMFDAFAQGRHCPDGFGIGLWLVQRLARIAGHELEFWSRPQAGSRFRVTVPLA